MIFYFFLSDIKTGFILHLRLCNPYSCLVLPRFPPVTYAKDKREVKQDKISENEKKKRSY